MKMRKSEHKYSWLRKFVKGIRRVSFAIFIIWSVGLITESNRMVLNAAAARLGQSLRETEDQLIRDMLAASASIINCVGGANGGVAVLKSDLMDSELSADNAGDNEAQASERMAA